jgi:hypothetical protein
VARLNLDAGNCNSLELERNERERECEKEISTCATVVRLREGGKVSLPLGSLDSRFPFRQLVPQSWRVGSLLPSRPLIEIRPLKGGGIVKLVDDVTCRGSSATPLARVRPVHGLVPASFRARNDPD